MEAANAPKSFSALVNQAGGFPASYAEVHALPIGGRAPVLTRETASDAESWKQIVLLRVDKYTFQEYDADGVTTKEGRTVIDMRNADGVAADGSLSEEWGMTFKAAQPEGAPVEAPTVTNGSKSVRFMLNNIFSNLGSSDTDKPSSDGGALAPTPPPDPAPNPPPPLPPPPPGAEQNNGAPAPATAALTEPKIGQRVCIGENATGIVWTALTGMVGVLYDDFAHGWDCFDLAEFAAIAKLQLDETVQVDAVREVLVDKSVVCVAGEPKTKKPAAALSCRVLHDPTSGWDAYTTYTPMPDMECYAVPPIAKSCAGGHALYCKPPFLVVSTGADRYGAPKLMQPTSVWLIGIMIGVETWNSPRGPKAERRRFALVRCEDTDYMVSLESVSCVLPSPGCDAPMPNGTSPTHEECISACKTAAAARKPGAVHSAVNRGKAESNQLGPSAWWGLAPRTPTTRKQAAKAAGKNDGKPLEDDGAGADKGRGGRRGKTGSGIPLKMQGWAIRRLDKCSNEQLIASINENGLTPPGSAESDVSGYAKQKLLRRFKNRNYPGYKSKKATQPRSTSSTRNSKGASTKVKKNKPPRSSIRVDSSDENNEDDCDAHYDAIDDVSEEKEFDSSFPEDDTAGRLFQDVNFGQVASEQHVAEHQPSRQQQPANGGAVERLLKEVAAREARDRAQRDALQKQLDQLLQLQSGALAQRQPSLEADDAKDVATNKETKPAPHKIDKKSSKAAGKRKQRQSPRPSSSSGDASSAEPGYYSPPSESRKVRPRKKPASAEASGKSSGTPYELMMQRRRFSFLKEKSTAMMEEEMFNLKFSIERAEQKKHDKQLNLRR